MTLNLSDIKNKPSLLTFEIVLEKGEVIVLRPLEPNDTELLSKFLKNLSLQTREYYKLDNYNISTAQEFCNAISRYDKLRFVVIKKSSSECIALFEYSLDIPENDKNRYLNYNIQLNLKTDCRMGPCISDTFQNRGIGSALLPYLIKIAQQLGQKRMILWGGVFKNNERAIKFYKKNGFKRLGAFINQNNKESLDMMLDVR